VRMLHTVCSHTRSSAICVAILCSLAAGCLFKQAYRIAALSHLHGSSADACHACCPEMRLHNQAGDSCLLCVVSCNRLAHSKKRR
jgi:hypothetical protein